MATASTPLLPRVLRAAASQMRDLPVCGGYEILTSCYSEDQSYLVGPLELNSEYEYRLRPCNGSVLTSIFRNSVHFASSVGSGQTLLILGAGMLRRTLREDEDDKERLN